jgi:hypothetical protein
MLVNAKTKLQNQNHIQNSLKQVKSENPSALYRMMNPAENATKLMVRQQEEDKDVKPNHFINFREKLRYQNTSGGELKPDDTQVANEEEIKKQAKPPVPLYKLMGLTGPEYLLKKDNKKWMDKHNIDDAAILEQIHNVVFGKDFFELMDT